MSFEWQGLWRTLQDSTFALWFGWSLIIAIVIFPVTGMFVSCGEQSMREDIEMAKLEAQHGDRETKRIETVKWMVSRGINPLIARCAVYNSPSTQCASAITSLEDEDRSVIADLIQNPGEYERVVDEKTGEVVEIIKTVDPREYIEGLDFGLRSPAQ